MTPLSLFAFGALLSSTVGFRNFFLKRNVMPYFNSIKVEDHPIDGVLQPILNNLLIKVNPAAAQSFGGVIIPEKFKKKATEGLVVASGPGKEHPESGFLITNDAKLGEKVIYGEYDGIEITYGDAKHQLIKDENVLLRYNGEMASLENVICPRDRILIELPPAEDKNSAGIIINIKSESNEEKPAPRYGIVLAMGSGRLAGNGDVIPIDVKIGDKVRLSALYFNEIKLSGKLYIVVKPMDILAKY